MGRPSKYPEEFRREVVALRRSSERGRCQVAKDLGIADGTLAAWENEFPYGKARGARRIRACRVGPVT